MPARNAVKIYFEGGYYHLYNRGVDKGDIFSEEQDYRVFISYLGEYLSPPVPPTEDEIKKGGRIYIRKNYFQKIELLAFVLMPNHFHLMLKQHESRAIEGFMRSLNTRYSGYFNKYHQRTGHLLQSVYKGVIVESEEQFLWLSRYIHRNPLERTDKGEGLAAYPYSSYQTYLGITPLKWINSMDVLGDTKDYRGFVENAVDTGSSENVASPDGPLLTTYSLD